MLPAGGQVDIVVTFDATGLDGGDYTALLVVRTDDPDESEVAVTVLMDVTGAPDMVVSGEEVVQASSVDYTTDGARTVHSLTANAPAAGGGTLEIVADGDYGDSSETATLSAEGTTLGATGPTGSDCLPASRRFVLTPQELAALIVDGQVDAEVQNTIGVNVFCTVNRHRVTLRYPTPADHLDFGAIFLGLERELALTVTNAGSDVLELSSIGTDAGEFVPSATSLTLLPRTSARLAVRFGPNAVGTFTGTLTVQSNDPDTPLFTVALSGTGQNPPIIGVQPTSLTSVLVEGAQQTQTLTISNSGESPLEFDLQITPRAPAAVHSTFAGLSLPIAGASNNPAPQESAPVHEDDAAGGEPRFLAEAGDFELLQPSPVPVTCVVEDRSANVLYAQQNAGTSFYRYRAVTNAWEPLTSAPLFSGNNGGAALLNGKIYTSYTDNFAQLGVYDIAGNFWSTRSNPLGQGTGNIASDGVQFLYLVTGFSLVRLDPATGSATQLASPPFNFQPWGGLRHSNGVLYGHQGNGTQGFAKYDVASNTWMPLPNVPGGAVLGAVIDPATNEYVAYGDYSGNTLYRYSIRDGMWSVVTIPFFPVNDGGLAWLAAPVPAVYFVQGELGTGLARMTTVPEFLSLAPTSGTVPAFGSLDVSAVFDTGSLFGGIYLAEIRVASNDPVTPQVVVPATLTVIATPDIAVGGDAIVVESTKDYSTIGAATAHVLPVSVPPGEGGTLELVADGDYGDVSETATVTAEGITLGSAGGVFSDCIPASAGFALSAAQLAGLIADGQVDVGVQNSPSVEAFCPLNRHTVRLQYTGSVDPLDFGPVFVGATRELSIVVFNQGSEILQVTSITTDTAEFAPAVGALSIGPRSMSMLSVLFEPGAAMPFSGTLTLQSNDPDEAVVTVALQGRGQVPPEIDVSPTSVSADLFTGQRSQEIVTIQNTGGSDLDFEITVEGSLPGAVKMRVHEPSARGTGSREASSATHTITDPAVLGKTSPMDGQPEVSTGPEESHPEPLRSDLVPENYTWQPLGFSTMSEARALLIQDTAPWGTMANEHVLGINDIAFDMIPSAALAATNLNRYRLVIVPSDQPTAYYSRLAGRAPQLNDYVSEGGILEFHAAGWGNAEGDASLVTLPDGMQIHQFYSSLNDVLDPTHPLMAGVPDPFFGGYASHSYFSNVPASATVIVADQGARPNLVTYRFGRGLVIAGGQTFEYGYTYGQITGQILRNMIPFTNPAASDWLQPEPLLGTVPAGGSLDIVVTFDAAGLHGGLYDATFVVRSNDIDEPVVAVAAHMAVTGAPDVALLGELNTVESTQNYQVSGARTTHVLPVTVPPGGGGTLELVARGDYGDFSETATVTLEDLRLGDVGRVGTDCLTASGEFPIAAADLARLVADGVVSAEVQNSSAVDAFCAENSHTVRLHYRSAAVALDFESLFVGACRSRSLAVINTGTEPLAVTEVATSHPDVTVDAASFTLAPGASRELMVTFCPSSAGVLAGAMTLRCNDPDESEFSVALHGEGLVPPDIDVAPRLLSADLFTGGQTTKVLTIENTGGSALEFEISLANAPAALAMSVAIPRSGGAGKAAHAIEHPGARAVGIRQALGLSGTPRDAVVLGSGTEFVAASTPFVPGQPLVATGPEADNGPLRSDRAPANFAHQPLGFSRMAGATVLLIQDIAPWGTAANEAVLADNGIAFDMIPSSALASTDLSAYALVIVPSDQPAFYYSNLVAQATQLNEYVHDGGTLEFHAAAWGFAGGDASIVTLPEGMRINHYYSNQNDVLDPSHPLVAGVPDPFFGTDASHAYFSSAPAGATLVAADDQGRPNLVVYGSGRGRVIAGGQTFEYGFANGQDAGLILRNMIPFAHHPGPTWLSAEPFAGTVPAAATLEILVTFDATGLNGGDYDALLLVKSNDPDEPMVDVAAHMHVTGAPDIALLGELQLSESTQTYQVTGARTTHDLPVTVAPGGGGTLELVALGDYGFFGETATVTVEGMRLGEVGGNVGTDCLPASGMFQIATADLARLVADGVVNVEVQNSSMVDVFCVENSHTVRLRYRGSAGEVDFGSMFVGLCQSRTLEVTNTGTDLLTVSELDSDHADVTVQGNGFTLEPGDSRDVVLTFCPSTPGPLMGTVTLRSNDPDEAELTVALRGEGLVPPEIALAPQVINEDLVAGQTSTRILQIANNGGSPLTVSLSLRSPLTHVMTAATVSTADPGARERQRATSNDPSPYLESYRIHAAAGGTETPVVPATELRRKATQGLPRLDATVIFEDDMESGINGWSHASTHPNGVDLWMQTTSRASSGSHSWNVAQHPFEGGDALRTPPIDLTGFHQAALAFNHFYDFDDCGGDPTFEPDGGIVEVSTDGGANWQQIFPAGSYPYVLDDVCGNPLAFDQAYSHTSNGAFVQAIFDLSPFAGSILRIRFHAGWDCGNCDLNEGWYIDDVSVTSLTPRWVSVSPQAATIAPQGVLDVEVAFDATALAIGSYDAQLVVGSNDPDEPTFVIPVNLQVWDVGGNLVANPETVNLGRNGQWVTSYVEFTGGLDLANVIVSTVRFNRDAPADVEHASIGDADQDGVPDLMLKFGMQDVRQTLTEGDEVPVIVTGEMAGGTRFLTKDILRVIRHGVNAPNGGERLGFGETFTIGWTVPQGWDVHRADLTYSLDGGISWNVIATGTTGTSFAWSVPPVASQRALVRVTLFDAAGMIAYDSCDGVFEIQGIPTAAPRDTQVESRISLQNGPNPFKAGTFTTITFQLPRPAPVSLKVYDVAGKLVRTLREDWTAAGRHLVQWDGLDNDRRQVAAGIYFCRLHVEEAGLTRRMLVLR